MADNHITAALSVEAVAALRKFVAEREDRTARIGRRNGQSACSFDYLNPCWNNRPGDKVGQHWGSEGDQVVEACGYCHGKAVLNEIDVRKGK